MGSYARDAWRAGGGWRVDPLRHAATGVHAHPAAEHGWSGPLPSFLRVHARGRGPGRTAFLFQVVLASIGTGDAPVTEMHRALAAQLDAVSSAGEDPLSSLREVVAVAAKTSPEAQFEFDLDCALRGIADRTGIRLGATTDDDNGRRRRRQGPG